MFINSRYILLFFLFVACQGQVHGTESSQSTKDKSLVTIFFIQHAEMNLDKPKIPLTPEGVVRASQLIRTFSQVPLTHVYSSHTLRARQTVLPVAETKGLEVQEFPQVGSSFDGQIIGDASPSVFAIVPLSGAIKKLPLGSMVLVAINSNNLFAIMNSLGVPKGNDEEPCKPGAICVPCTDNSCFPKGFDGLWVLTLTEGKIPIQLLWLKY